MKAPLRRHGYGDIVVEHQSGWQRFWSRWLPATKHDLGRIEKLMALNQTQLTEELNKLTSQQGKIAKEQSDRFDAQAVKIQELTDAINAGGSVTPEVETALSGLKAATQSLDDAIPDAPA